MFRGPFSFCFVFLFFQQKQQKLWKVTDNIALVIRGTSPEWRSPLDINKGLFWNKKCFSQKKMNKII